MAIQENTKSSNEEHPALSCGYNGSGQSIQDMLYRCENALRYSGTFDTLYSAAQGVEGVGCALGDSLDFELEGDRTEHLGLVATLRPMGKAVMNATGILYQLIVDFQEIMEYEAAKHEVWRYSVERSIDLLPKKRQKEILKDMQDLAAGEITKEQFKSNCAFRLKEDRAKREKSKKKPSKKRVEKEAQS